MDKANIGKNAGVVWRLLNRREKWCFTELQKESKLCESDFYLAVGWLAREDKVEFVHGQKEEHLSMKFDFYF